MIGRIYICIAILLSANAIAQAEDDRFPYRLDVATDAVLLSLGCAVAGTSFYLYSIKPVPGWWETMTAQKKNLNWLDRQAVGRNLKGASTASDVCAVAMSVSPLFLTIPHLIKKENMNALTLATMNAEVMLLVFGINNMVKALVHRKRPYLYDNNLFERSPRDRFSASSFYSLHASFAFGSMAYLVTVVCDLYNSSWKYLVLAGGLTVAGLTGYLRFAAGLHFPTDILAGACIGTLIGCLIPLLHKIQSDRIAVSVFAGRYNGFQIGMRF